MSLHSGSRAARCRLNIPQPAQAQAGVKLFDRRLIDGHNDNDDHRIHRLIEITKVACELEMRLEKFI